MYFGDYDLLPSKTNLAELAQRVAGAAADPKLLTSEHRGVLALLRMADRGGPRNSDSLLRWDPDPGEGVWHATEETELSG